VLSHQSRSLLVPRREVSPGLLDDAVEQGGHTPALLWDQFSAAIVGTAMKSNELGKRRDSDEECSMKLLICHSVLVDMKTR
jgi:hypothetical protein